VEEEKQMERKRREWMNGWLQKQVQLGIRA
jgi:hypothetical protein